MKSFSAMGQGLTNRNLLANLAGSGANAVLTLLFVPIYLRFIGAEGYGLIGFFTSITIVLSLLDGGTGTVAARELARTLNASPLEQSQTRSLLRSLDLMFCLMAGLLALVLCLTAPWLAKNWLQLEKLKLDTATLCLRLLACSLALQWPCSLYNSCLIGLQRQLRGNLVATVTLALRNLGSLAALYWRPVPESFFAAQLVGSLIAFISLRVAFWSCYPGPVTRPSWTSLRPIFRFSLEVSGVNALAVLMTQMDKLVLSQLLTLTALGRYTLAWNLAMQLTRVTNAIFNANYPRFTQLAGEGQGQLLGRVYRRACLQTTLGLMPAGLLMSVFSGQVIWVWTGQAELAQEVGAILTWLALGTLCNGLMTMPYALQLAHGSSRLSLRASLVAIILLPLWVFLVTQKYGQAGAASGWFVLNFLYLLTFGWLVHVRFLPTSARWWLFRALLQPALLCLICVLLMSTIVQLHVLFSRAVWILILPTFWSALSLACWLLLRGELTSDSQISPGDTVQPSAVPSQPT